MKRLMFALGLFLLVSFGVAQLPINSTGGGGGGGYDEVQDEGVALTTRTTLDFAGAGVTCVDSGGTKSLCTVPSGGGVYPTRAVMWHYKSLVTVGNANGYTRDSNQIHNHYSRQSAAADGDTFTNSFLLAEGTYDFEVWGLRFNNRGKIDWYVDDVLIESGQDWYKASPVGYDFSPTVSSVAISGSGRHVLKGVVSGKHASSSDYLITITTMEFVGASDAAETE